MISFSAEALASMARAGDQAAFERLLAGNRGLVIAAARKACGCRWRQFSQEAIAAAEAGLWLACQAFELGCDHWPRLAFATMRREARKAIREALGSRRALAVGGDALDQIEAKQVQSSTLENLDCSIGPWDRRVIEALYSGYSQRETAAKLGIGVKAVRTSLARVRKGLANA